MDTLDWHVYRIAPGAEELSASLLPGVEVYSPFQVVRTFNRRNRVYRSHKAALFPGYVFIRFQGPQFPKFPPSPLLFGFARNGDRSPMRVRNAEIEIVRKVEWDLQNGVPIFPHGFHVGDMVTLKDGPLAGLRAIVQVVRKCTLKVEVNGQSAFGSFEVGASRVKRAS